MRELRVLVIDDDASTREANARALSSGGYAVAMSADGAEGLSQALDQPYDLVILGLKKKQLLDAVKTLHDLRPETPTIALAQRPTVDTAVEIMRRGAFHFAGKIMAPEELLPLVARGLAPLRERLEEADRLAERRLRTFGDLESLDRIDAVIARHGYRASNLIGILQDTQNELRYLPEDALRFIARRLDVPLSRVYGVATFYKSLSLKPRGRHTVCVCLGTACHVKGGVNLLEKLERELHIKAGETTYDERFSLETVRCVGCCGLAPVFVVGEDFHGKVTQDKVPRLLEQYE